MSMPTPTANPAPANVERREKSEQELRSEYAAALPMLQRLREEVEYSLRNRLDYASVKLHSMVGRTKAFESMLAKTRRYKNIVNPVVEMNDMVGVRAVCL